MLNAALRFRITQSLTLFLVAFSVLAETLSGRVLAIADADTLTLLTEAREQMQSAGGGDDKRCHGRA